MMNPIQHLLSQQGLEDTCLVYSSKLTKNKFVSSEFDTRLDAHFKDPNDHHFFLDIDSLNSIKIVEPILQGIELKSGDFDHCWD